MTTTISPDDYCKHPEDYINSPGIDNVTRAYWDKYCQLLKLSAGDAIPTHGSESEIKKIAEKLAGGLNPDVLQGFLKGFISSLFNNVLPNSGLKLYQLMLIQHFAPDVLKTVGKWLVDKGVSQSAEEAGIEMTELGVDNMTLNIGTIAGTTVDIIAEETTEAIAENATSYAGEYSIASLAKAMATLAGEGMLDLGVAFTEVINPATALFFIVQMALQMIGMILDEWDPCNLNEQLDANALRNFSNSFNNSYVSTILSGINSFADSYGHLIEKGVFPIQYYAENGPLIPMKKSYYDKIYWKLYFQYLTTLTYNSDGFPIYKPTGGKRITSKMLSGLKLQELSLFSNNNTVVENWLSKWWPIILGTFILIFVLILVIKIRNGK